MCEFGKRSMGRAAAARRRARYPVIRGRCKLRLFADHHLEDVSRSGAQFRVPEPPAWAKWCDQGPPAEIFGRWCGPRTTAAGCSSTSRWAMTSSACCRRWARSAGCATCRPRRHWRWRIGERDWLDNSAALGIFARSEPGDEVPLVADRQQQDRSVGDGGAVDRPVRAGPKCPADAPRRATWRGQTRRNIFRAQCGRTWCWRYVDAASTNPRNRPQPHRNGDRRFLAVDLSITPQRQHSTNDRCARSGPYTASIRTWSSAACPAQRHDHEITHQHRRAPPITR